MTESVAEEAAETIAEEAAETIAEKAAETIAEARRWPRRRQRPRRLLPR